MGLFLKFFSFIMSFILAFWGLTPSTSYEPEKVDIQGTTYKNCFLPEYARYNGFNVSADNEPFYSDRKLRGLAERNWYKISDNIITPEEYPNPSWGPTGKNFYCPESNWDELKAFYKNKDNWAFEAGITCYVNGINEGSSADVEIERRFIDDVLWDEMMQFVYDCEYHLDEFKTKDLPHKEGAKRSNMLYTMESVDGLFSAGADFIDYEGTLYYVTVTNEGGGYYEPYDVVVKVPDNIQKYIRSLEENVGFSSLYNANK